MRHLVLSALIDIFHFSAQAAILSTSFCVESASLSFSLFFPWVQVAVSSANRLASVVGESSVSISLIKMRKSSGDIADPWGSPWSRKKLPDLLLLTSTLVCPCAQEVSYIVYESWWNVELNHFP